MAGTMTLTLFLLPCYCYNHDHTKLFVKNLCTPSFVFNFICNHLKLPQKWYLRVNQICEITSEVSISQKNNVQNDIPKVSYFPAVANTLRTNKQTEKRSCPPMCKRSIDVDVAAEEHDIGRTHPSFGMTPTFQNLSVLTSQIIFSKSRCHTAPRPSFFWHYNDKDLNVYFLVTHVISSPISHNYLSGN